MKLISSYYVSSGIPLGGIGCGTIEVRGDGRFYEWHIFNNGPWAWRRGDREKEFMDPRSMFFGIRAEVDGHITIRLLQAAKGYDLGGDPYVFPWLRSVDRIEFDGEPPFAFLRYFDKDLPLDIFLEAFTPLIPGDVDNSSIPVAIFMFRIVNRGYSDANITLVMGIKNPFSEIPAGASISFSTGDEIASINIVGKGLSEDHCMYNGSLSIGVIGKDIDIGYILGIPISESYVELRPMWVELRSRGIIRDGKKSIETTSRTFSIIMAKTVVKSGQELRIPFVLAWYFPNHIDDLGIRLGHYYENMFSNSEDVFRYVAKNIDYLYEYTRKFHDILYNTSIDKWIIDLIASQITTIQKSSILTKDGLLGMWEGYGCCGLNTTDVAFYGSIMILQLFPQLERKWIEYHYEWILDEDKWPYYETYALAYPENVVKLKDAIAKDPSISTDLEKFRKTIREIVRATGKDPRGRVMHFFTGSFKRPDTYDRPDMNPEYILMVIRDSIWLGDIDMLKNMWIKLKDVVDVILKTHDPFNKKLIYHYTPAGYEATIHSIIRYIPEHIYPLMPYRAILSLASGYTMFPISVQTFDTWSLIGYTSFTGVLWIAALKAMEYASRILSDRDYLERISRIIDEAKKNLLEMLWNGEYLDLWHDPASGMRDKGCSSSQLDGQMYLSLLLDLGYIFDREKILSILRSIYKYNFKGEEGLINGSYPGLPRPSEKGDMILPNGTGLPYSIGSQIDTPWTGIEFEVAAHMIHEDMINESISILRSIHERYSRYGEYWNHIECGGHYYRAMDSWLILMAIEGLFYNGIEKRLRIVPKINNEKFKGLLAIVGSWGTVEHTYGGGEQRLTINLERGSIKIRKIEIPKFGVPKEIRAICDGKNIEVRYSLANDRIVIECSNEIEIKKVLDIYIKTS